MSRGAELNKELKNGMGMKLLAMGRIGILETALYDAGFAKSLLVLFDTA